MQIRRAANIGRGLVVTHLIMHTCLFAFNIIRMLPMIRQNLNPTWFITTPLYYLSTFLLDIALLIVLSSLARTKEQLIHDTEEY